MRLAIYGAGAMGTVLGAYITRAGYNVDLITRNKSHVLGLNKSGAKISGKTNFIQKVNAMLPEQMKSKYDIILLMTKQLDNKKVVESLVPFLSNKGVICTMQNGLPERSVSDVIGKDRTIGCAMSWGATMIGNGEVKLTSENNRDSLTFSIGKYGNVDDKLFNYIVKLLTVMGNVKIEKNFTGARWAKLLVNSSFSGPSTLTNANFGEIAKNKKSRLIVLNLIKECIEVAKKAKIKIEPIQGKNIVKLLDYRSGIKKRLSYMLIPIAIRKHKMIKSSMLDDIKKGRKCEIEAINGVICKCGDEVNIDTPFNDRVVEIVKKIENGLIESSWNNLILFDDLINS